MASDTTSPAPGEIYAVFAHPNWQHSRVNRRLLAAAREVGRVHTQDLYGAYADYHVDVPAEQARLAAARLVVLVHPVQWYSMPALLKLWLDEVLTHGWAYGEGGAALRGKDLWLVTSTGGPEDSYHPQSYNRYFFEAFLPPYEQTAALCGLRFLPPLVFHGAHSVPRSEVEAHVATFRERLASYPAWPELDDLEQCAECEVPWSARPPRDSVGVGGDDDPSDAGPPRVASAPDRGMSVGPSPDGGRGVRAATRVGA